MPGLTWTVILLFMLPAMRVTGEHHHVWLLVKMEFHVLFPHPGLDWNCNPPDLRPLSHHPEHWSFLFDALGVNES
jgi:hypothetical protein